MEFLAPPSSGTQGTGKRSHGRVEILPRQEFAVLPFLPFRAELAVFRLCRFHASSQGGIRRLIESLGPGRRGEWALESFHSASSWTPRGMCINVPCQTLPKGLVVIPIGLSPLDLTEQLNGRTAMILLQVHLQQPCYDFCFL
jgi:hypothetical protein